MTLILKSIQFAAHKHRDQLRKDGQTPYINHPIEVAEVLWVEGKVRDPRLIAAAILHDTIEDTETTPDELRGLFGQKILSWVQEVTDDKSLSKAKRKHMQVIHAPTASKGAKQIKIADKICNIRDLIRRPPAKWHVDRKQEYLTWSDQVVEGLHGCNQLLEVSYEKTMARAWSNIK
ncbi:MAG: bifunctional (p)ppGpp synthetase/guanosine-3',5'-bis(diphosphate) 3'-pyrophosphohydrolase [SAR324 cluster bacterium]|nr:bifunctional (p)ppGpp synthetase/guanosine-3',5'-bis(diphosphate) 3'-pyrophosphohydrolase [SAR324 cluster bacterium]